MVNNLLKKLEKKGETNTRLIVIGGFLILTAGIGVWINSIYLNPNNIFWDSFSNNLSTVGFTKQATNKSGQSSMNQLVQVSLSNNNYAHSITTLTQSGTTVVTEEINGVSDEYVRYINISTNSKNGGSSKNFKPLLNKWGYQSAKTSGKPLSSRTFYQTIFGILPFSNLTEQQRSTIVNYAKTNKVYTVNAKTIKHETLNGQNVYTMEVTIKLEGYIKMMQQLSKYNGFEALKNVDPAQYAKQPPVVVKISINPISRNLVQINNGSSTGITSYSGFGINPLTQLPKDHISLTQLQKKIQSL